MCTARVLNEALAATKCVLQTYLDRNTLPTYISFQPSLKILQRQGRLFNKVVPRPCARTEPTV